MAGFIEKLKPKKQVEKKVEEKVEPKKVFKVVKELPVQQIREYLDEENNELVTFMTNDEALSKILNGEL